MEKTKRACSSLPLGPKFLLPSPARSHPVHCDAPDSSQPPPFRLREISARSQTLGHGAEEWGYAQRRQGGRVMRTLGLGSEAPRVLNSLPSCPLLHPPPLTLWPHFLPPRSRMLQPFLFLLFPSSRTKVSLPKWLRPAPQTLSFPPHPRLFTLLF